MKLVIWIGRALVVAGLVFLTGCPQGGTPSGSQSGSAAEEHPAIKEAKTMDNGDTLAPGASREVTTDNGVVIVAKDAAGKVTYTKK